MCVKKASQVCNMVLANLHNFESNSLVSLCRTYVSPYPDCSSVFFLHITLS